MSTLPDYQKNRFQFEKLSEIILNLEKQGLNIKHANLLQNRVQYCRGKDLIEALKKNSEKIGKQIFEITGLDIGYKGEDFVKNFYNLYSKIFYF